jgi:hypothetical protein
LAAASHAAEEAAAARATEEAAAAARATEAAAAKAAEEARVAKEKVAAEEAAMEAEKTRRAQQMEAALADLATAQARVLRADQKLKAAAADEAEPGWLTDATHRLSAEDRLAAACVERETASDALCSSLGRRDPALPGSPVEPSTRRRRLSAESTASLQEEVEMQRNAHINLDRLTLRIDGIEMYTRPRLTVHTLHALPRHCIQSVHSMLSAHTDGTLSEGVHYVCAAGTRSWPHSLWASPSRPSTPSAGRSSLRGCPSQRSVRAARAPTPRSDA